MKNKKLLIGIILGIILLIIIGYMIIKNNNDKAITLLKEDITNLIIKEDEYKYLKDNKLLNDDLIKNIDIINTGNKNIDKLDYDKLNKLKEDIVSLNTNIITSLTKSINQDISSYKDKLNKLNTNEEENTTKDKLIKELDIKLGTSIKELIDNHKSLNEINTRIDTLTNSINKRLNLGGQNVNNNLCNNVEPYYKNNILIVNKKHPLPCNYAPGENAEAKANLNNLIKDMLSNGLNVSYSYSGYRSYEAQSKLYQSYVNSDGQAAADTYSARAGYSEHQTGLTFDLLHKNGQLVEQANEVKWVANNAHKYGFIIRYPYGKDSITGYHYEPWHLRYLGIDIATKIYNSNLTLEEYLGVEGGNYY